MNQNFCSSTQLTVTVKKIKKIKGASLKRYFLQYQTLCICVCVEAPLSENHFIFRAIIAPRGNLPRWS